jgi:predicted NBD/HSP70 family sugar kinase
MVNINLSMETGRLAAELPPTGVGTSAIRDINSTVISTLLRNDGPLTRAELVRRSGLSRPTVVAIVRSLLEDGVALQAGADAGAKQGGRPGALLAFNPRTVTVAAGRLKSSRIDARVADSLGNELGTASRRSSKSPGRVLPALADLITQLHAELDVGPLAAAAIIVGGRIDSLTGCVSHPSLGWTDVPVQTILEGRLRVPVTVVNPAAAAALGSTSRAAPADTVVTFLDMGIGAGIISGGQLIRGSAGAAGEFGHCRLPYRRQLCRCGQRGCLETVSAGWHIQSRAAVLLGPGTSVPDRLVDLENLHLPKIDALLREAASELGLAASWLVTILNPSSLLFGGTPYATGATMFLNTFRENVLNNAALTNRDLEISFADPRADIIGAFRAAIDLLPATLRKP